jgi:hypothetical protein
MHLSLTLEGFNLLPGFGQIGEIRITQLVPSLLALVCMEKRHSQGHAITRRAVSLTWRPG